MTSVVALFGAAGNMGTRIAGRLRPDPAYELLCVEADPRGIQKLRDRGDQPVPADDALARADIVILAVPDKAIGQVAARTVPRMRTGAMIVCLDPAAPYAGQIPDRPDICVFVTHPAHPPLFNDETDPEARRDYFGSGKARQAIVNALMRGPDSDYARGEALARAIWGPVLRSHRVTVEQMAMLEPVLSETVAATCVTVIREAMDEAVRRGVPAEAARDFILGHLNIELAICFDEVDWKFSAGAQQAIEEAKQALFQPDWKKAFDIDRIKASTERISTP